MPPRSKRKLFGVGLGAGLAGAVFLALKYAWRPRDKARLPDSISPAVFGTKVLDTSLGHLIYHEAGSGPPLLFIHSVCLGGSSYEWSKVYPEFAGRFRVLAPDLIGFGESQRPDALLGASDYVRMLMEFIQATCAEPPIIVASGLGGGFCARLAARHPELVAQLILHMPSGGNDFGFARLRWSTRLAARAGRLHGFIYRNYQSTPAAVRNWLASGGYVDPALLSDEVVDVFATCAQQGGAEFAIRNFHAGRLNFDLEEAMRAVCHPVALLWGIEAGYPPLEQGQRLRDLARRGELVVLPRVGALGALENPRALIAAIGQQLGG